MSKLSALAVTRSFFLMAVSFSASTVGFGPCCNCGDMLHVRDNFRRIESQAQALNNLARVELLTGGIRPGSVGGPIQHAKWIGQRRPAAAAQHKLIERICVLSENRLGWIPPGFVSSGILSVVTSTLLDIEVSQEFSLSNAQGGCPRWPICAASDSSGHD